MLAILSAIFGFAMPFLPQLLKIWQAKGDRKHELDMLKLRLQSAASEHSWRMEEINARADIAEAHSIRQQQVSFGVQILDAAAKAEWGRWVVVPVFWLFSFLDFISGSVRTVITYAAFFFYIAYKWAVLEIMLRDGAQLSTAILNAWTENDWAVLTLVLSYWFGARAARSLTSKAVISR